MPADKPLKPAEVAETPLSIYSVFQLPGFDANADPVLIAVPHFDLDEETPDAIAAPGDVPPADPTPSGDPATDHKEN